MYCWQKWNSTILTRKASLAFLKHGKYHSPWNINILFDCCRIACFNFFHLNWAIVFTVPKESDLKIETDDLLGQLRRVHILGLKCFPGRDLISIRRCSLKAVLAGFYLKGCSSQVARGIFEHRHLADPKYTTQRSFQLFFNILKTSSEGIIKPPLSLIWVKVRSRSWWLSRPNRASAQVGQCSDFNIFRTTKPPM